MSKIFGWRAWMPMGLAALALSGCSGDKPAEPAPAATASSPAPAVAATPVAAATVPLKQFSQKVWVIGFDGVDPKWLQDWVNAGKLPNFKKLIDEGTFKPLTSTNPPQSPVAWSSFATGTNPGGHGVYDFIRRDPKTYFPGVGSGDVSDAKLGASGEVVTPPKATTTRSGDSFWKFASSQGIESIAINLPFAFPPEEMSHGAMLSGLGTPDLRGTNSTFTFFSSAMSDEEAQKGVAGGKMVRLEGEGPTYQASFDGPMGTNGRVTTGVSFTVDAAKKAVSIAMPSRTESVPEGKWSDWFEFQFEVSPKYTVHGIGRFYVVSTSPLSVFMYPPNIHPEKPWLAFTAPAGFGAQLRQKYGIYKTLGWSYDTNALVSEKLSDKAWMEDMYQVMDKTAEIGLGVLKEEDPSLFIWVETATDRVAHMFTRATDKKSPRYDKRIVKEVGGDPILLVYQRMDAILGRFMSMVTPDVTLMVVSDHGQHTYRRGLHTNAWLADNGYMVLKPGKERGEGANLFNAVDWGKTKAYSLGTGQIYINLAGREGRGIVQPGAEYDALVGEIAQKLVTVEDPKTREKPVVKVYKRNEIYKGVRFDDAPDLQVAFAEGWRTSWETMLGAVPAELFADNTKKWSGDHSASDVSDTAGVFLSNRKLSIEDPALVDIAPTVLSMFGLQKPAVMEGRDLFAGSQTKPPVAGK